MATKNQKTNILLQKLQKSSKGAFSKSKNTEAKVKGANLPGGLIRAVCQITAFRLDETQDKKQPYTMFTGVVHTPSEFKGTPVNFMYFFNASKPGTTKNPQTVKDRWDSFCSDIKLITGDDGRVEKCKDEAALIALCTKIATEEKPFVYFNTSEGKKNPKYPVARVFYNIQGVAEDFDPEGVEEEEEIEDEEEEETEEEETEEEEEEETEETEEEEEEEESEDEEEEEEEETEEFLPAKKEIYGYKSGPKKKAQDCEVIKVVKAKETVDLKRLSDDTILKDIPWSKLQDASE